jgi:histone H3/H4
MSTLQTKRKRRASTNAIREIKTAQNSTENIIPVAPFNRLTQEISHQFKTDIRFKADAHKALHIGAEDFLVELFQNANSAAIHSGRETVQVKDLKLALDLKN